MDAYTKLDWSKNHRRSEPRLLEYFAIDFSSYEEDIFNLHINEIDPVHQLADVFKDDRVAFEYPIDPRSGTEVRQLVIDTSKAIRLYDQFPSGSRLNRADHQHCLTVLNRLNMRLGFDTADDQEALARYRSLIGKLEKERQLFDSFVRNYFNNNLVSRKRTVDQELDDMVVMIWKRKVQTMMQTFVNGIFHLSTAVMWLKYGKNERNVSFEPVSEDVLEFGQVMHMYTENMLSCSTLKRSTRVLDKFLQDQSNSVAVSDFSYVDTILKQDDDVRFVINSGTLTYLLDNASNMQSRWMIPFRIVTIGDRNVIFIDKKLQPTKMMTHERNIKAHKYLVRSFMTILKKDMCQSTDKNTANQKAMPGTSSEYKVYCFDKYLKLIKSRMEAKDKLERHTCLRLWKLQDNDEQYRFLIRSRMDCYESLRKMKFFINVSIKLEYQAEFGAEQMTRSELIREWTRQFMRPNSKTLRLRINAVTHTILSHHYLELRDIEDELKRTHDIEPANLITNLWQTLKLLLSFPPGEHLMQHDIKNPQTVLILSKDANATAATTSVNLNEIYSSVEYEKCALEEYDWIPIDKTVITKLHREHTLLPCTFPHWNTVQHIISRENFKPKPKPVPLVQCKLKTKSRGNRVRRKQKEREKKQQQRKQQSFVAKMQQSLDLFAPYAGPSWAAGAGGSLSNKSMEKPALAISFVKSDSIDYKAYVDQANVQKQDQ
ncbi:uncharacterized protein LOC131689319 [Topomyia yanbarensis]|uniref:uncharacterized protein LOC131689319 n=1 Tax=Topomyia yanbarensis TaxID=2498891 RepID=UPI00273B0417|nr:uncharacterized protein LOC131689319 [Topomyia yanbarensis]